MTVNAHYVSFNQNTSTNVIDSVGVRAVDENSQCVNIGVNLNECTPHINGKILKLNRRYSSGGIKVTRHLKRVHISVPNCADIALVMWVICERQFIEGYYPQAIKTVIMRGLNVGHRASHGLIGK